MKIALSIFFLGIFLTIMTEAQTPVVTNVVLMKTTMGDFTIELYGNDAPKTVANFVGLVNKGFYDGILFHRVVPGFVIQVGDPKTKDSTKKSEWGTGGESIYGASFEDEFNQNAPSYKRGYVEGCMAMANAGPNTNSSQLFICFSGAESLPKAYSIFGLVTKGMDVAHAIEKVARDRSDCPITPVKIISAKEVKSISSVDKKMKVAKTTISDSTKSKIKKIKKSKTK